MYMRHYATLHDPKHGSKPMIYDILYRVVYSKYKTYDMLYMRLYATCRCFLQGNGRVAGFYFEVFKPLYTW